MPILKTSDTYSINGIPIAEPSKASVKVAGIQTMAERTDDGLLHKETIAFKRTVSIVYDVISQEEIQSTTNLVLNELYQEFFTLQYLDPQNGIATIECYANEFGTELYSAICYNGLYRNVTFNCIER